MTTRDEARRRADSGRGGRGRSQPAVEPQPTLPERLLTAREAKGVDLYRAERDTKIRARYLGALERGDYRELPGSVYTKGFLRNYALYLGLDPDEVLLQWRRERGEGSQGEPSLTVPRPLSAPRQGFTFSFGLVVAAALTVAVVLFVVYLGFQLLRFSQPPAVAVTDPANAVSTVDDTATAYTLRGTSLPGALVSITVAGRDQPVRTTASSNGTWEADVELRRGKNQFSVSATDPDTGKSVEKPVDVVITVPFPDVLAPTLTVDQPAEGATFENGAIPVQGTTANAKTVTVAAAFSGAAGAGSGTKPAATPAAPDPQTADIGDDGTFNVPVELTAGNWVLTITAASPEGKTTSLTRNVSVRYKGVNLVVSINGGNAWMKVWVDGQLDPRVGAGKLFKDGRTITFRGDKSVEVFTGSSGVTYFTLNGTAIGRLGKSGNPETWLFEPPNAPVQTNHR